MKVKTKDKTYDSEEEPVMIILNDNEKRHIKNMSPECTKYLSYPDWMSTEEATIFMVTEKDNKL